MSVFAALQILVLAADPAPAVRDAVISTSHDHSVQLKALWGKPVVLFYEDRDSTQLNEGLKQELFARGVKEGLLESVRVVAVANLSEFDWFPARNFALAAVRSAEEKAKVPVYVDWKGALLAPPFSFKPKTATVAVLDRSGVSVFEATGALDEVQREVVFGHLKRLVGERTAQH